MRQARETWPAEEDAMRRIFFYFLVLTVVGDQQAPRVDSARPTSGFGAEFLGTAVHAASRGHAC
ncbi:MAG: hypothetical protein DMG56_03940 [Acidobacteria bacterium]|nr:MAG: hypothetical protein DMG54_09100 [Acidobacteriota bacterium]PYU50108.1 MAG: hypothetical protein DMG53_03535 [Acidobacteriota bacterium]PYU65260.1 MAG: hypothetical protein DMG56_03940 [Acidobacteriota bacterium]PYU75255.1 MAG: hypothetical protein DMG52_08840 [Acidobacteriota bacterium]